MHCMLELYHKSTDRLQLVQDKMLVQIESEQNKSKCHQFKNASWNVWFLNLMYKKVKS